VTFSVAQASVRTPRSEITHPSYTELVRQIATVKIGQLAAKYGEQAPVTTACCNACRSCVQTNLLSLAVAGLAFVSAPVSRRFRRRS
jgi:hypothetical protein